MFNGRALLKFLASVNQQSCKCHKSQRMGISGLLPLLKEVSVNGHISEFKGKK